MNIAEKVNQVRDLEADLAICEAATPGPWEWKPGDSKYRDNGAVISTTEGRVCNFGNYAQYYPTAGEEPFETDIEFITSAREGWPYAIKRATDAEAEVDRLRNELNILQEQMNQSRRCWD